MDVDNTVISKWFETKNNSEYSTRYSENVIRQLVLRLPKLNGNVNSQKGSGFELALHPCRFSKNFFSRETMKPCFLVTFSINMRYIFLKNSLKFLKSFRRYKGSLLQY